MKHKLGSEMKKLIFWATFITLLLLISVITYFMIDVAVTTNNNIEHNKQMMIDQAVSAMNDMGGGIEGLSTNVPLLKSLNPEFLSNINKGDFDKFREMVRTFAMAFYPVEYFGLVQSGELMTYDTAEGVEVDTSTMPTQPPEGKYTTMDKLGEKEGFFISVFAPVNLSMLGMSDVYANLIMDRTAELQAIEDALESQRDDLLLRLSIAAVISIILFILLTTLGLRSLVDKYVMQPIDDLNETAQGIVTGTFEGEVEYDPDSSFAPIQGLLRSGQKVLSKLDDEIGK